MKYEISDDLRKKALNNNADIERIASLAITDICKIVNVPDETCFQIDDSNLPLTNWARRDGNIVKIKISSFILNPVKIPRSVGCRKVDSIDYHERDCKCVYAITHEGAEPLITRTPLTERLVHNTLGEPFEVGENEEGLIHSCQMSASDIVTDRPIVGINKEDAFGFLAAHKDYYFQDKYFICGLDTKRISGTIEINKNPWQFCKIILSSGRRALIAKEISNRYGRMFGNLDTYIGVFRDQFFRLCSKLKNPHLIKTTRDIYSEFEHQSPEWRILKEHIEKISDSLEWKEPAL